MTDCKNCKYTDEYCASGDCTSQNDLTEKWVNIYKYGDSYWTGVFGHRTKEDAIEDLADKENYLTTINIEEVLKLQEQNTQLKELLKECRPALVRFVAYDDSEENARILLMNKINEVLK